MTILHIILICLYVCICFIIAADMVRDDKKKNQKEEIDVEDMAIVFFGLVVMGWLILPLCMLSYMWKKLILLTVGDGVDYIIAWWENRNKQKNDATSRYQEIIAELEKELEEVRKENK